MPTGFVLVHSPLVGPASWSPVAAELRARGREVAVPSLVGALPGPPPRYAALAAAVAGALPAASTVLAVHSAAGALVPSIVAAAPSLAAVVFVDATLPHPGRSRLDSLPAPVAEGLRASAGPDGLLPPWPDWFAPEVLAELLPDERVRAEFCADVPRVPLGFLTEVAPSLDGWRELPAGYLQLSDAYRTAADEAGSTGWPVARLAGHHLSTVTAPAMVAAALLALADVLLR